MVASGPIIWSWADPSPGRRQKGLARESVLILAWLFSGLLVFGLNPRTWIADLTANPWLIAAYVMLLVAGALAADAVVMRRFIGLANYYWRTPKQPSYGNRHPRLWGAAGYFVIGCFTSLAGASTAMLMLPGPPIPAGMTDMVGIAAFCGFVFTYVSARS